MSQTAEWVTQCELRRETEKGHLSYVAFIPRHLAVRGRRVTLRDKPGNWVVHATFASLPAAEAAERSRDHAHQREASDA